MSRGKQLTCSLPTCRLVYEHSQQPIANHNKESECQVNDSQLLFLSSLQRRKQLLISCLQLLLKRSSLVFELLSVILHRRTCTHERSVLSQAV